MPAIAASRLDTLLSFLRQDPANLALAADAIAAALDEGRLAEASALVVDCEAAGPLPAPIANLAAVLALRQGRFADAAQILRPLVQGNDDPGLRANLAWALAMMGDHEAVAGLVDDAVIAAVPAAAQLKVQALHRQGRLDDALAQGEAYALANPEDRGLMSALAVAAIDAEQPDLARGYALRAGDTHEGLSTLGVLALNDGQVADSKALFDKALRVFPHSGRGLLGKGLVLMAEGDAATAAGVLEQAAQTFKTHLGSWVAAGWAHFAAGDLAAARATFDKALEIDANFAETHGALAVLDILEGQAESARQRTDVALRLDRKCFSAALAKSLLAASQGDEATAERVRRLALNSPVGEHGETLAQAMARLNSGLRSPDRR